MSTLQERIDSSTNSILSGKESISNAIVSKGVTPLGSTFADLTEGINSISVIEEAPEDGVLYGRKDASWSKISDEFLSKSNEEEYTPTSDYNPSTKKYVDDKVVTYSEATTSSAGLMSATDKSRLDKAVVPTVLNTVSTLTGIPIDKYNIKFTYSSTSPIAISFASTPEEGAEYIISIYNSTSSNITQPIPNATGWQSSATSVTCPAGKITEVSIRYIFGKYIVRI